MARILSLDLGTKTGWAHSSGQSGVQNFAPRRGASPGIRWLEFAAWLRRLLDAAPADLIVYEQAHHRGGAATHVAHSLIGQVEAVAAERGLDITSRHTATIKKHATGKGNADKADMRNAFERTFQGRPVEDDNEIDACWLLDLTEKELSK